MPITSEPTDIKTVLMTDGAWSVYAIGDMDAQFFRKTQWHIKGKSLALLYRGFEPPVLFTTGSGPDLESVLNEIKDEEKFYLSVRENALELIKRNYAIRDEMLMMRMIWQRANDEVKLNFRDRRLEKLTLKDIDSITDLFSDGNDSGEAPDFFSNSMVEHGIFYGIRADDQLIAVAGTHIVSKAENVAAIGCVYTRRDHRGRGLSKLVTGVVVSNLLDMGISTIALNVRHNNFAALSVYKRLGFIEHCPFYEGLASRFDRG